MPKGLRLSFNGITCTVSEIKIIAHTLGYDPNPVFGGWGNNGGYRNFFVCNSKGKNDDFTACENLVKNGLMNVENGKHLSCCDRIFHVTEKGKDWFSRFRRNHPHADFKKKKK